MNTVAEFYAQIIKDEENRQKMAEIIGNTGMEKLTDDQLEKIGRLAQAMGFSITLEEARKYLASGEAAISDEALDAVAGGMKADAECKGRNSGIRRI